MKEGIAETDEYKRRLALYQVKALREPDFFNRRQVTERSQPKAADDQEGEGQRRSASGPATSSSPRSRRRRTSSAKLGKGDKFEDLAKKYKFDGSKDYGGDLGDLYRARDGRPSPQATFGLKVGQTSQPVKTDFGWHIIRLEDRKQGCCPALRPGEVGYSDNVLLRKKVSEIMDKIRAASKIEIVDEDLGRNTLRMPRRPRPRIRKSSRRRWTRTASPNCRPTTAARATCRSSSNCC